MTKQETPVIRFNGFTNDWEHRKLKDEVVFYSGLTYSPDNIIDREGILVLRSSNVKNSEIVTADDVYVDSDFVNSDNVVQGDIVVVVRNGSRALIGKHAIIKKEMPNTVIGAFMTGIRSKEPDFINTLLNTQQFDKEINKNLGATINQITTGAFKEMTFKFPKEEEQHKIGTFFRQLDDTIALQERKLDLLKEQKKGFLQKMFPKKDEKVPEIRFKGFTDDWEQRKLGELSKLSSSKRIHLSDYVEDGVPFYRGSEISSGGIAGNQELYISYDLYRQIKKQYGVPKENDLLVTAVGTLGNIWKVDKREFYFKDGNLIQISELKVETDYLFTYLNDGFGKIRLINSAAGSNQKALTMVKMRDIEISLPKKEEQSKIGNFFKQLDETITLQEREVTELKAMKKSFLQKMFV